MKTKTFSLVTLLWAGFCLLLLSGCGRSDTGTAQSGRAMFHCPMHPTYVSERQGDCPICNMKLVPIKGAETAAKTAPKKFHCPMHPTYVSDRQGDCPICNMKLVPIKQTGPAVAGTETAAGEGDSLYHCPMCPEVASDEPGLCPECNMKLVLRCCDEAAEEPHAVPGRVMISVSAEKRHLIGLKVSEVERRELVRKVRTPAVVQHDETRYSRMAPRFAGWIRKLHVNFTGAPVQSGQPLFTVYSPDLFSSENEYLLAWRALQQIGPDAAPTTRATAEALLRAARTRLELFQVDEAEIRSLEDRGTASSELLFRAPFSGHVLRRVAVEGQAFNAGDTLFEIADLARVWLQVAVYEHDFPQVALGQRARVTFPYLNREFESAVTFVSPHIDPQTRRGEVRLELDNPEGQLRPDMWAEVELLVDYGERLTVPASAVIDTGERYVAFVDREDEHLEPREVKLGVRTDDFYEVLSGLEEGERVVTRALFLIDAESQLKSAIAAMTAGNGHDH